MKALVTGATGLVGKHLVEYLLSQNAETLAIGRDQKALDQLEQLGAKILSFDLTSDFDNYSVLEDYEDYVWFHVAAAISGAKKDVLDAVNIQGTAKLVKKGEELTIPKFILVSSISTYGISLKGSISEKAPQQPDSYYGQTKLEQEKIVKNSKLTYSIVRPPYIGGPHDQNFLEEYASRIERGKMPTFSKNGLISYIDARDLSQALYLSALSDNANNTSYNVYSEIMGHKELVELIGEKLLAEPPYGPHYPYSLAMVIGFFAEIIKKFQGKSTERGISRYRIRTLCRKFVFDNTKIEKELNYQANYTISESVDDWLETRI